MGKHIEEKREEKSVEKSTEESTENSIEKSTGKSTENSTEKSTGKSTENSIENSIENSVENSTEESAENSTGKSTEKSTGKSTEKSTGNSIEKSTDKSTEKSAEKSTEKSVEESVGKKKRGRPKKVRVEEEEGEGWEERRQLVEKREKARRSLGQFALYTDENYRLHWHHKLLAKYLDRFVNGKNSRLIVVMPPRHGKSELVSRKLPAYLLGVKPDAQIIAASYTADLAHRMNRDVQRIMDSPLYGELFPEVSLSGKGCRVVAQGAAQRTSDFFEVVNFKGSYRSTGVGGGITGMGADYIIVDDPIKNKEDALSQTMRDKVWDWYTSTLYTRREGRGNILVTLTRWHEDDLVGRLLQLAKENPRADQWEVLHLPAMKEGAGDKKDPRKEGEALWPQKFPLEELLSMRANVGAGDWSALYQGNPKPEHGVIFRREWMSKRYTMIPSGAQVIQTWDLPFKSSEASAKCAGLVMARKGSEIFILDCVNEKMGFTESVAAIKNMGGKHPEARGKVIEDKANGSAILDFLKKDMSGMIPFQPRGSKEERARSIAPYFEAGNVYFKQAAWTGDLVEDLVGFPHGKYKDTVDALVQGVLYLMDKPVMTLDKRMGLTKGSYWS